MMFLLGVAGLAIDIGRMYITKSEAQAYVDSASLNAAMQLDGTSDGITRATSALSRDTGKWNFDTTAFSSVTTTFATTSAGPFTATPLDPTNYNYVQVAASVNLPMYLIRPFSGPTATVGAAAVAGRRAIATLPSGVFPFSPYTRKPLPLTLPSRADDTSDPFGYKIGNDYTLRWGKSGCGTTDIDTDNLANSPSVHGYCCGTSASDLRQKIVGGQTDAVTIGQGLSMPPGVKSTEMRAIAWRVDNDTDNSSTTYLDYIANGMGNGQRVVVVAVNGGGPQYLALGFAGFFLNRDGSFYSNLNGNNSSACAEYIGAWTQGVTPPTPNGSGAWRIRLVQ